MNFDELLSVVVVVVVSVRTVDERLTAADFARRWLFVEPGVDGSLFFDEEPNKFLEMASRPKT